MLWPYEEQISGSHADSSMPDPMTASARSNSINADGSQITAAAGMTWQSFGERISVDISPAAMGSSVRISSRPKVASNTMDGGKGFENVELFAKALLD